MDDNISEAEREYLQWQAEHAEEHRQFGERIHRGDFTPEELELSSFLTDDEVGDFRDESAFRWQDEPAILMRRWNEWLDIARKRRDRLESIARQM